MDTKKIFPSIACPFHPKESVQRFNVSLYADQHAYCLECILEQQIPSSNLKSIEELIDLAVKHYEKERRVISRGSETPKEYQDFITKQNSNLEKLMKHIEGQKKKTEEMFDGLTSSILSFIQQKRTEYLTDLEKQIGNLRYWYGHFNRQVQKTYTGTTSEEDTSFIFPQQDDLYGRLEKISNIRQLENFVQVITDDLNEADFGINKDTESSREKYIHHLLRKLGQVEVKRPEFDKGAFNETKITSKIIDNIDESLHQGLILTNPILNFTQRKFYTSCIAKPEEFELIRKWLGKSSAFTPKLLYSYSRDGKEGEKFHELCVGKGATITLVKAKCAYNDHYYDTYGNGEEDEEEEEEEENENEGEGEEEEEKEEEKSPKKEPKKKDEAPVIVLGGYLDKSWEEGQIYSEEAFLFSLTNRIKCPVTDYSYAGNLEKTRGPCFGEEDLVLWGENSYSRCGSYLNTAQLLGTRRRWIKDDEDYIYFNALEVEVFSFE